MRTTRHAANRLPVLLLLWAASRVGTALAERGKPPCRADDVVVFYTAKAPPLTCFIDTDCDVTNGTEAGFRLGARLVRGSPYQLASYVCNFEQSDNLNSSALFRESVPEFQTVFEQPYWITEEHVRIFIGSSVICLFDSDLPDDFFHLIVQRPHEDAPFKCRVRDLDNTLYLRFPRYPIVICELEQRRVFSPSTYRFKLTQIVGEPFSCAFLAYDEVNLEVVGTEQQLHHALIRGFPGRETSGRPWFNCSSREASDKEPDFEIRISAGDFYNCRFLDPDEDSTETAAKRFFGW
ncbi:uncharacterized protein LOC124615989 [Schistocerca americana]|uniref:uncharacterized protein LOC124615989 n=1 Tax=Schistocerca americana TaxID=7009 RepID=UPI001F5009AC|nr:uncharacterized protein LOC124615989 [Schistocerca americana]